MIAGFDPGAGGGLALLTDGGDLLAVDDMPVVEIRGRKRVAAAELARRVGEWAPRLAVIEQTGAMPKQGVSSTYAFGYASGLIEGVCAGMGIPVVFALPAVWKRALKVTADKGACRLMAQRLWPTHAASFAWVRDDGRAEAALVGFYGRAQWQRQLAA